MVQPKPGVNLKLEFRPPSHAGANACRLGCIWGMRSLAWRAVKELGRAGGSVQFHSGQGAPKQPAASDALRALRCGGEQGVAQPARFPGAHIAARGAGGGMQITSVVHLAHGPTTLVSAPGDASAV